MKTIFQKIIDREIPADIVYETDEVLAFRDIAPQAPVHVVIIPKLLISRLSLASSEQINLLGKLLFTAAEIARKLGIEETGFRAVINNGPNGGESVPHLHVHLLGGRPMKWPPG